MYAAALAASTFVTLTSHIKESISLHG